MCAESMLPWRDVSHASQKFCCTQNTLAQHRERVHWEHCNGGLGRSRCVPAHVRPSCWLATMVGRCERGQRAGMARVPTAAGGGATQAGPAIRNNQVDTETRGGAFLEK
jgi:hypothetical protein